MIVETGLTACYRRLERLGVPALELGGIEADHQYLCHCHASSSRNRFHPARWSKVVPGSPRGKTGRKDATSPARATSRRTGAAPTRPDARGTGERQAARWFWLLAPDPPTVTCPALPARLLELCSWTGGARVERA